MHLNLIGAVILIVVAMLSVLVTTTTAHAQGAGSGFHGNFSGASHGGGGVPAHHSGALSDAAYRFRGKPPRLKVTRVAGVYPWNDPRWRYRLYGMPYPFYYYEPICGFEREPYGVGKRIRWRRVYRCH